MELIKKALFAAAAMVALPMATQAQSLQYPGLYVGAIGGLNWLLNNSFNVNVNSPFGSGSFNTNGSYNIGWAAGGMIGYDFVGPRVELEAIYRDNYGSLSINGVPGNLGVHATETAVKANALYDFNAGGVLVPYIGAGAGVAFTRVYAFNDSVTSMQFAYQAMLGVGYNINPMFRVNLEGRYYGTTSPNYSGNGPGFSANASPSNNNISVLASLQVKFGAPTVAAPPPAPPAAAAPSYMVFFDWDRSNLSEQALNTIRQAAGAYKTKGSARITATGHTDTSGPEAYNMALSLRRANTVKDALVREGVPATAIAVVGRGESQPLVQTGDGVREPQNRRVEIVIQ
jgi:outer membrane protein OmpA-like peptidoglycan-associated protein